jgi:hypothetical protein
MLGIFDMKFNIFLRISRYRRGIAIQTGNHTRYVKSTDFKQICVIEQLLSKFWTVKKQTSLSCLVFDSQNPYNRENVITKQQTVFVGEKFFYINSAIKKVPYFSLLVGKIPPL